MFNFIRRFILNTVTNALSYYKYNGEISYGKDELSVGLFGLADKKQVERDFQILNDKLKALAGYLGIEIKLVKKETKFEVKKIKK